VAVTPYTTQSIAGYNASPPPDDGSLTDANKLEWAKHKEKLGDPLRTLAEGINSQCVSAFNTLALNDWSAGVAAATVIETDWHNGAYYTATGTRTYPAPSTLENGWHEYVYNGSVGLISLEATASGFFREGADTASGILLGPGSGVMVHNTATVWFVVGRDGPGIQALPTATDVAAATDTVAVYDQSLNRHRQIPISDVASLAFVGEIRMWPTNTPPSGWLVCDGSAVSRTTYANLFAVLGVTYGAGDASTTFNIPDLRGRVAVGGNNASLANGANGTYTSRNMADNGGAETHTLVELEMPQHRHLIVVADNPGTSSPAGLTSANQVAVQNVHGGGGSDQYTMAGSSVASWVGRSSETGSGNAHENMPPFLSINYIIRT
jgi:microcystin-dependent protein